MKPASSPWKASASAPAICPLYRRSGMFCMAAKGSSSAIVRKAGGKKGSGTVPPARKSAVTAAISRTPTGDSVWKAEI